MARILFRPLLFIGLLGFFPLGSPVLSAQTSPADSARALLTSATSVAAGSTPDGYREAIRLRLQAAAIFRRLGDRRGEGEALAWTGDAWYQLGEPDSALHLGARAFPLRLEGGDTTGAVRTLAGLLGPAFEALGQRDSAVAIYHRARELAHRTGNPLLEARATQNLGSAFFDLSRSDSALTWFHTTLALNRRGGDHHTEVENLVNIAIVHDNLGHVDTALAYARDAWRIGREQASDSLAAHALLNLGVLFTNRGAADSALSYYRLAAAAADRAPMPRNQREARLNIGIALAQLGQGDSALSYYREAIRRSREAKDRATEARALSNLGILFVERKQFDSATATYRQVLETYRSLQYRRGEGIALVNLAKVYSEQGQVDSALNAVRMGYAISREIEFPALETVALNQIGYLFTLRQQMDSALVYLRTDLALSRKLADLRGEGVSLMMLGLAYATQQDFPNAVAYFDSTASIKSRVALQAGGDFNRTTLGEKEFELYDVWTKTWLARSKEIGSRRAAVGALGATERGRAQALLDLMGRTEEGSSGATDLSAWARELVTAATRAGSSILVYHASADTLIAWTAGPISPLQAHAIPIGRDSLASLVARLRYALGVDRADSRISRGGSLERGAIGASQGAGSRATWISAADALAQALLPRSVRAALVSSREILLVPHGVLALVPFTLLPWDAQRQRLGARAALRYSPSLGTAIAAESRPGRGQWRPALVVGNPFMPTVRAGNGDRVNLTPLPAAELEARAIGARLRSGPLEGAAATETAVRNRLGSAAVIHLATHGYAYSAEGQARNSFVALAPDSLNDGLLTVGEILDDSTLTLTADLVALSACQTGLGDLKQAEGTIGLQRAFLARGARSVLVSLWNVSDDATRLLMERFYAHWLGDSDHQDKAEALRRAQADVRAHPGFQHPRYWAGFQLVGAR